MRTKSIVIWVIIIIAVLVVGYVAYKSIGSSGKATAPSGSQAASANATSTRVQGQDVSVGTGAQAKPGDTVSVLYTGSLQDGTVFDSSAAHGNKPLTFVLGSQGIIPGFQIGVNGMKVGGERLLSIPPTLGYGSQAVTDASGTTIIPASSTLIFDVKLVNVQQGTSTPATGK